MSGYTTQGLAPTQAVISNGQSTTLKKVDGSDFPGSPVAASAVVAARALDEMRLPANETVLKDGQSAINIGQYDDDGFFAGQVNVAANNPDIKLANATTRIVVNEQPATVADQGGKTAGITVAVDQGALQDFPFANGTDCIISDGQALTGVAPTGTYTNTVTFTVAGGVITGITLS